MGLITAFSPRTTTCQKQTADGALYRRLGGRMNTFRHSAGVLFGDLKRWERERANCYNLI